MRVGRAGVVDACIRSVAAPLNTQPSSSCAIIITQPQDWRGPPGGLWGGSRIHLLNFRRWSQRRKEAPDGRQVPPDLQRWAQVDGVQGEGEGGRLGSWRV